MARSNSPRPFYISPLLILYLSLSLPFETGIQLNRLYGAIENFNERALLANELVQCLFTSTLIHTFAVDGHEYGKIVQDDTYPCRSTVSSELAFNFPLVQLFGISFGLMFIPYICERVCVFVCVFVYVGLWRCVAISMWRPHLTNALHETH